MSTPLDQLTSHIIIHPLFLRLKSVIENSEGWHEQEDTYAHSLKTASIARRERDGGFVPNPEAKKRFVQWMTEDVFGMQQRDILVIVALLHDCGKILHYKENGAIKPLVAKVPNADNQTFCPGHEYWGGEIATTEILKEIDLSSELKTHIAQLIKLHGTFQRAYFSDKKTWSLPDIIDDIKARAESYYKESLFNAYCDGYTARAFQEDKRRIEQLFNEPSFYSSRMYFIT